MAEERGKVIEFKPRPKKKKLKSVKYVDPVKKELLKKREKEKKISKFKSHALKNIGIFVLICFVVYLLKIFF